MQRFEVAVQMSQWMWVAAGQNTARWRIRVNEFIQRHHRAKYSWNPESQEISKSETLTLYISQCQCMNANGTSQLTLGTSISGNSLSNLSISSSPVTLTAVLFWGAGVSKSSNENPPLVLPAARGGALGNSVVPSSEMSGKADAARSKSISSLLVLWNEDAKSPPKMSLIVSTVWCWGLLGCCDLAVTCCCRGVQASVRIIFPF